MIGACMGSSACSLRSIVCMVPGPLALASDLVMSCSPQAGPFVRHQLRHPELRFLFFFWLAVAGQYHCDQCGICRVGGRENFFHCERCGCCYAKSLQVCACPGMVHAQPTTQRDQGGVQGKHKCVEGSMQHDCAVCLEFLFNSTAPISVLKCGHTIHSQCLEARVSELPAVMKQRHGTEG